ncbi:hypothetical protein F5X68DRAFT_210498 [Plectosphaerella plurivora]|uniref:Uncharacterized protein n=1 Tax=Plectosphaerella plurivora TaxID=936078 RepID=A0A9P8VA50_9PEZI|nr:hypothetical protein F5X68DRAFT_210498 [Plectosphaerella plurivora]
MDVEMPHPFAPGTILKLKSHAPPHPFGKPHYRHQTTPGVDKLTPQPSFDELLFARHPRERHDDPEVPPQPEWFNEDQTARLKIIHELSQSGMDAQVVVCKVLKAPKMWKEMEYKKSPKRLVAKIYDPLRYCSPDVVAKADAAYAQEAAAYFQLHSHLEHPTLQKKPDLAPRFYGTWTTDIRRQHLHHVSHRAAQKLLPNLGAATFDLLKLFTRKKDRKNVEEEESVAREKCNGTVGAEPSRQQTAKLSLKPFRPVRIILMEEIEGSAISYLCVKRANDDGNRILVPGSAFESEETTDFSNANVSHYTDMGQSIQSFDLPMDPADLYDMCMYYTFAGWFPADWVHDDPAYRAWAKRVFPKSLNMDSELAV